MLSRVSPAPASVSEFYFFGLIVPLRTFFWVARSMTHRAPSMTQFAPGVGQLAPKRNRYALNMTRLAPSVTHRTQDDQDLDLLGKSDRNYEIFMTNQNSWKIINGYRIDHILFIKFLKISSIDICWMQL